MSILDEIREERKRQDDKWGEQNHPITLLPAKDAESVANDLREKCDEAFKAGEGSWEDILLEEVYEALEQSAKGNYLETREELIQVAAVVVAMIECLDRNGVTKE